MTDKKQLERKGHTSLVQMMAYSPDSKLLATGSDNEFKLWDAASLQETYTERVAAGCLAFTDCGTLLFGRHHYLEPQDYVITRWDVARRGRWSRNYPWPA